MRNGKEMLLCGAAAVALTLGVFSLLAYLEHGAASALPARAEFAFRFVPPEKPPSPPLERKTPPPSKRPPQSWERPKVAPRRRSPPPERQVRPQPPPQPRFQPTPDLHLGPAPAGTITLPGPWETDTLYQLLALTHTSDSPTPTSASPPDPRRRGSPRRLRLVTPPKLLHHPKPPYPYLARRQGLEGSVKLRLLVSKTGEVLEAKVVSSQPEGVFDQVTAEAARKWRFRPARDPATGQAVEAWTPEPIVVIFRLQE